MQISVIMSVYNNAEYVEEAINSVLKQTHTDFEFLISDDGSTDQTRGIIESFQDNRIRFFPHKSSLGLAVRLNEMIEQAKGKYIARMDGDDICEPHRLAEQLHFLEKNLHISVAGSWAKILGSEKIIKPPLENKKIQDYMLFSPALIHPSVMIRKKNMIKKGLIYPSVPCAQDYGLWLAMSEVGLKFANINKPLLQYRIHPDSTTQKSRRDAKKKVLEETMGKFLTPQIPAPLITLNAAVAMGEKITFKQAFIDYGILCWKMTRLCKTKAGRIHCLKRYIKTVIKFILSHTS